MSTSLSTEAIYLSDAHNVYMGDLGNVLVRVYYKRNDTYLGYSKCEIASVSSLFIHYEATLSTSDIISNHDEIGMDNCIYVADSANEQLIEECMIPSDGVYLEIAVYYNGYDTKDKGPLAPYAQYYLSEYCLTNLFITDSEINFFKDINNIEYSTVTIDQDEGSTRYKIKSLPMLKYSYAMHPDNMRTVTTLLEYFRQELQKALSVIENNFDIDMKFYNTYGPSQYFIIGRDQAAKPLGTTGVKIYLNIKLNQPLNDIIKNDIESYIINFIEDINNNDETNYLYISNLIKSLENNFDYIRYIEYDHLNNEDSTYQVIENTFQGITAMTKQQVIKYVPEYLNVSRVTYYDTDGTLAYRPEVYITYI
jgi:hypothetical protein